MCIQRIWDIFADVLYKPTVNLLTYSQQIKLWTFVIWAVTCYIISDPSVCLSVRPSVRPTIHPHSQPHTSTMSVHTSSCTMFSVSVLPYTDHPHTSTMSAHTSSCTMFSCICLSPSIHRPPTHLYHVSSYLFLYHVLSLSPTIHRPPTHLYHVSSYLFLYHVLMHLPQSGVSLAMHRLAVDVVTIDIALQQQHRYVACWAQIDKLLDRMFNESLVEECEEQPLTESYKRSDSISVST